MKSVLQDWVMELGLRHQGLLLTAIRGCDTATKYCQIKKLTRAYRGVVLNAFVGDPKKSSTFIEVLADDVFDMVAKEVIADHDALPYHYVIHLVHAAEVVGYHHPDFFIRTRWLWFYERMCSKMHMNPETKKQMDARLGASEEDFKAAQF